MEKQVKELTARSLDCQTCRGYLSDFLDQVLSLEERQAVARHLLECEACFRTYADLVDEQTDNEEKALFVGDRPLWGPLAWGLQEDEEYLEGLFFLARQRERAGGVVLVKHHRMQEKSLALLFCVLSVELKRDGKHVVFADPATTDTLMPLLATSQEGSLYLLVPEGTRAGDFELFLNTLAAQEPADGKGNVIAIIGVGPEYGKEEESEGLGSLEVYTIEPPEEEDVTRFGHQCSEEAAAQRAKLAGLQDEKVTVAYTAVALLDAFAIPVPLAVLARRLGLSREEATEVVNRAKGLLFWVGGAREQVCTEAPAVAEQFLEQEFSQDADRLAAYAALLDAACQEGARLLIVRCLQSLIKSGRYLTLARSLLSQFQEKLQTLWESANAQEHVMYGKVLWTLGKKEEAVKFYQKGHGLYPENPYLLHALAVVEGKAARDATSYKAANDRFNELERLTKEQTKFQSYLWQARAELERFHGEFGKAEPYFKKALDFDSGNLPTLVGYANLELERGKGREGEGHRAKAEQLLRQARKIDPGNVRALHSLGRLEKERAKYAAAEAQRHLQKAAHYFESVLCVDPYNLPALIDLALLEKDRGHFHQAKHYLDQAKEIDRENLHYLTALGELWSTVVKRLHDPGAAKEAEIAFGKALEIEKDNAQALVGYAQLRGLRRQYTDAEELLSRAQKLHRGDSRVLSYVYAVRGKLALAQKNYFLAERMLRNALAEAKGRDTVAVQTSLATVLAETQKLNEARRILQAAHESEPGNVIVYNTEAKIEAQRREKTAATEALKKSLEIDEENAFTHWLSAKLRAQWGEREQAEKHRQKARDLGFVPPAATDPLDADSLYARYGQPFEEEHRGEYIAITQDGRTVVGPDDVDVLDQAIRTFGSGNFIFRRIGYSYVDQLRWGHVDQQRLSVSPGKGHRA